MDSACHEIRADLGKRKCDKVEGSLLWLIAAPQLGKVTRPVQVTCTVKSRHANRLQFYSETGACDELDLSEEALWVLPFYRKTKHLNIDRHAIEVIRKPKKVFTRASVRIVARLRPEGYANEDTLTQHMELSIAIPPGRRKPPDEEPQPATVKRPAGATKLSWLHISDLHISPDGLEEQLHQAEAIEDLLRFLQASSQDDRYIQPDFIFVTGDIAFHGAAREYLATGPLPPGVPCARDLLNNIAATFNLPMSRVYPVPGNHDISRLALPTKDVARTEIALAKRPHEVIDVISGKSAENRARRSQIFSRLKSYAGFRRKVWRIGAGTRTRDILWYSDISDLPSLPGHTIGIVGLCSCWLSQSYWKSDMEGTSEAKHGEEPRGHLALCEERTFRLLKEVEGADIVVAMLHHPLEYLSDPERKKCEAHLRKMSNFILTGHIHEENYWRPPVDGKAHTVSAGAVYARPEHLRNSFNLVEVDLEQKRCKMMVVCRDKDRWTIDCNAIEVPPEKNRQGYSFDSSTGYFHFPLEA
jgi:hypothetical protein